MKPTQVTPPNSNGRNDSILGFSQIFSTGSSSISGRSPSSEARRGGLNGAELLAILDEAFALTDDSLTIMDAYPEAPGPVGGLQ
jgi:hypothetical protein